MDVPEFKAFALWNEADWIAAIATMVLGAFLAGGLAVGLSRKPEFAGHPRGLYMLFFAEMWERFSYYGMRAILIFYLTQHWLFGDGKANLIYGGYTALVYITPVLGGYLADRYLGQRKAVLFGGVLLAFGHLFMAFEGMEGVTDAAVKQADPAINIFWLALALIIVGSGFLKANISVMVGQLYKLTDIRRDSAYTIFYIGINLGGAAGSILVGYLGQTIGWAFGFGLAGIGMVAGLLVFVIGKGLLKGGGEAPDPAALRRPTFGVPFEWLLYAAGLLATAVMWGLIQYQDAIQSLLIVSGLGLLGYVFFTATFVLPYGRIAAAPRSNVTLMTLGLVVMAGAGIVAILTAFTGTLQVVSALGFALVLAAAIREKFTIAHAPRDRMFAIIFLIALNPIFWGLFEQAGGSFNLYTDRFVDRGGVPAALFQSINSIYIILLGAIFAGIWAFLAKRRLEPSAPAKFALALMQVGLAFLVFVWGANSVGPEIATPVAFVFLFYFFQTTGELCLSPVGLSAMNRLAPKHLASLIMGAWFYMTAVGNFVAGKIGEATGGHDGEMTKEGTLSVYNSIGWWTIGIGVVVLLLSPIVKRWMHLDTLADDAGHSLAGEAQIGEPKAAGVDVWKEEK
ncbi:MFS transporter [Sphingomonas sp. Leaf16]|nr:MFS transporter [Sphingomonas sp. Leaf16]KQN12862.1 MFS transporter [Sphingomonas sp. Leaf29]KQN19749.1 MFS transporter [Sphingomonas sp. Leaf32]